MNVVEHPCAKVVWAFVPRCARTVCVTLWSCETQSRRGTATYNANGLEIQFVRIVCGRFSPSCFSRPVIEKGVFNTVFFHGGNHLYRLGISVTHSPTLTENWSEIGKQSIWTIMADRNGPTSSWLLIDWTFIPLYTNGHTQGCRNVRKSFFCFWFSLFQTMTRTLSHRITQNFHPNVQLLVLRRSSATL